MMQRKGRFATGKTHFKLYKAKKNWLVAGITLVGFGLVGGVSQVTTVNAATVAATTATNSATASDAAFRLASGVGASSAVSAASSATASSAASTASSAVTSSAVSAASDATTSEAVSTALSATASNAPTALVSAASDTALSQQSAAVSGTDQSVTAAAASVATTTTSKAAAAAQPQVAGGVRVKTQVSPVSVSNVGSLTEASAATPLAANNMTKPRNVVVTVVAKAGDTITLDVPWLFSAVSDQVMSVESTKIAALQTDQTETTLTLKDTLLTYHATTDSIQTFNVTLTAQDIIGGLNDQATFPVILAVDGVEQARLTYTVSHPVAAHFNSVALDHNQTTNLVTAQDYVYGVKLGYSGGAIRWSGNLSVAVPTGFVLTGGATHNNNTDYNQLLGDTVGFGVTGTTQDKMAQFTQPGGAGTPILISVADHYLSYGGYSFYFWGQYQTPVAQTDNTFTVTGDLASVATLTNGGVYRTSTGTTIDGETTLPVAVTDQVADQHADVQQIHLITGSELANNQGQADSDHVYLDPTEDNGTKQSDDTAYSYTVAQRAAVILNTGNVAQTNATLVVTVPVGTEAIKAGVNSYYYAFDTDVYNPLTRIVLTLANGQQQTYTGADLNTAHQLVLPAGDDGTQVVQIAATWAQVLAGKEVGIAYMNNAMTAGKIGDTITQNMTYTSDQTTTPLTATRTLTMVAAPAMPLVTEVMPYFVNLNNVYRPGDTFDMKFLIKTSRAAHLGTYYVTVPPEFDVNTIKWFGVSGLEDINNDVTDLGYIGANGEHVLKIDLSGIISGSFISNKSTGADMTAGFVLNVSVDDDALPITKPIKWDQIVQIVNADDYTRTNQQATITDTTYGSETAAVMAPQVTGKDQWTYQIVLPASLTAMDGIDDPASAKQAFVTYDAQQPDTTTAYFDKGATAAATDDVADSQIRLVTYNGTDQVTPWSQNLVVLPRTADGAAFDLTLTGAGQITEQSAADDAELLYSTQVVSVAANAKIDQSSFVTADQITDWASVRSILLTTGSLVKADVIQAYLPVTVPEIENAAVGQDNLLTATFATAKNDGSVYQMQQQLNTQVLETTAVTTRWVTQAADGTQTAIQPDQVDNYQTGAAYTTAALTATAIPAGYRLAATPTNANGIVERAGATVTYVYVVDNQTVTVHYIDVSGTTKTANWTAADGTAIPAATQTLTGLSQTAYQNTLVVPTGYRLVGNDAGAVAGTYDNAPAVTQQYNVYVVQDQQTATIVYVDQTTQQTLHTDTLTGGSGNTQNYQPMRATIQGDFEALGYVYVNEVGDALDADNVVNFDHDTTTDQHTTIYLKHGTVPVTPDQPQTPGSEIPNNPNNWPKGTANLDLNRTVTETVQYVYSDGGKVAADQHQSVTFQQVAIVDKVTGALLGYLAPTDLAAYQADPASVALSDNAWTAVNGDTLASLTSPAGKAGYTADLAATESYQVMPTTGNLVLTVTYQADEQKATVTYVDLDNKNAILTTDTLTGVSNGTQDYSQVRNAIQNGFEALGYVYVLEAGDALDVDNVVNFDSDSAIDQNTTIYLKHGIVPVTPDQPQTPGNEIPNNPNDWPKGTADLDLNRTVTETVQYVYSDGGKVAADQHQSVTFQRVAIVDKVTGALLGYLAPNDLTAYQSDPASVMLSDDAWTATNGETFASLTSPAGKTGYTADLTATESYQVTPTTGNLALTVTYQADTQKATVTYVDLDAKNAVLKTDPLTGVSNGTHDYSQVRQAVQSGFEALGYVYVREAGNALDADNVVNFDSDPATDQHTTIYLKHGTVPVTPDQPQTPGSEIPNNPNDWPKGTADFDLNRTVTETVQYVYSDGGKVAADQHQSVTFQRVAIVDKVTGTLLGYLAPTDLAVYQADPASVTLSDNAWTAVNGDTFASLTSPIGKAGYTADLAATEAYQVTPTTGNLALTVTYTPDAQTATVTYVDLDADNAVLKTDTLTGVSNGTQDYSQVRQAVQSGFEALGYVYVREAGDALDVDNVVNFDSDATTDQHTTIYLKHGTVPVTPDQPQTPGDEVPNNPNHWPNGVAPQDLKRTVTERIQYVYATGGKVVSDYQSQATFLRVAIVDKVTGALLGYLTPSDLNAYQADPTQVTLTTDGWTPTATTFVAVTSPEQAGYHADLQQVDAYSVTPTTGDLALVVTYTADLPDTDNPGTPTDPGTPTEPDTPDNPGTPTNPDTPDNPGAPTEPDIPDNPGTPTEPDTPDKPDTLTNPDTPENPGIPTNPDVPNAPSPANSTGTPAQPNMPVTGVTPKVPATFVQVVTPQNTATAPTSQPVVQPAQQLPQTGAQDETLLTELGLTLLGTVGLFGAAKLRKRHDGTYDL